MQLSQDSNCDFFWFLFKNFFPKYYSRCQTWGAAYLYVQLICWCIWYLKSIQPYTCFKNKYISCKINWLHYYNYQRCFFVCVINLQKDIPGKKDTNFRFLMAKHIQRPQLKFKDKIDNSNTPFIPIIKRKPNSLRPLEVGMLENISAFYIESV